jgi:signal transduction histidine kinase
MTGEPLVASGHTLLWPDGKPVLLSIDRPPSLEETGQLKGAAEVAQDVTQPGYAHNEMARLSRALQVLSEVNEILIHARDETSLLVLVCDKIVSVGGYRAAWVEYGELDRTHTVHPIAWADDEAVNLGLDGTPWAEAEPSELVPSIGLRLFNEGQVLGTLFLYAAESGSFDVNEIQLLEKLAHNLAYGIATLRTRTAHEQAIQELRTLSARLSEVEEAERKRLASDLHDKVGQNLTALNLNLNILRSLLTGDQEIRAHTWLQDSFLLVEKISQQIRDVTVELRPPMLDEYGLRAALRWHAEQFSARTGIAVQITGEDILASPGQAVEMALYRIAQEALNNISRHSQASQTTILIERNDGKTRLKIDDDGIGFDPAAVYQAGKPGHWGLQIMRERADAIGGSLTIDSSPGKGARITVEV